MIKTFREQYTLVKQYIRTKSITKVSQKTYTPRVCSFVIGRGGHLRIFSLFGGEDQKHLPETRPCEETMNLSERDSDPQSDSTFELQ